MVRNAFESIWCDSFLPCVDVANPLSQTWRVIRQIKIFEKCITYKKLRRALMLVHFAFICLGQDLIMYVFDYCFNSVRLFFFNQGILLYTHFLYEERYYLSSLWNK